MSKPAENQKYAASKIPARSQEAGGAGPVLPQAESGSAEAAGDGLFYVIDYELSGIEGVGKFVPQPQKIQPPAKDEIRDLFYAMREIGRASRTSYFGSNRLFDKRAQLEKAAALYKQGVFMQDFADDYTGQAAFQEYFPYYQMMNYEQLRTYFTWRTAVRRGEVAETSLSYAFLYMYELLNNIGVENPQDGLDRLVAFWAAYRGFDGTIDKYVLRWLKDYHIYYPLPHSFKAFVEANGLAAYYPNVVDTGEGLDLFYAVSRYDIRKSAFYAGDKVPLVADCFAHVVQRLRQGFAAAGVLKFDDCVFQPGKKMQPWRPFKDALFHHRLKQPDRRLILSEHEIYVCSRNNWAFNSVITIDSGRQLVGYVMKQMEAVLRAATHYKYKLAANLAALSHPVLGQLARRGLRLDEMVRAATLEFYREATKTVVEVDAAALSRIRREALATQEKLIVEEPGEPPLPGPAAAQTPAAQPVAAPVPAPEPAPAAGPWQGLRAALDETELSALRLVLQGEGIKAFADGHGLMLEVLVDGINEKAFDAIGDNLLDEEFTLYGDYIQQVREITE